MHWTPRAVQALDDLVAQVPPDYRATVRATAEKAAHLQALQIGNQVIDTDEVVMGYLQAAPASLRAELLPILQAAGIEMQRYRKYLN